MGDRFGIGKEKARSVFLDATLRHYSERSGSHTDVRLWSTPDMDESIKNELYSKINEENKKSKFYEVLISQFADPERKSRLPVLVNLGKDANLSKKSILVLMIDS